MDNSYFTDRELKFIEEHSADIESYPVVNPKEGNVIANARMYFMDYIDGERFSQKLKIAMVYLKCGPAGFIFSCEYFPKAPINLAKENYGVVSNNVIINDYDRFHPDVSDMVWGITIEEGIFNLDEIEKQVRLKLKEKLKGRDEAWSKFPYIAEVIDGCIIKVKVVT